MDGEAGAVEDCVSYEVWCKPPATIHIKSPAPKDVEAWVLAIEQLAPYLTNS